jgi:hypothetical protein
MSNRKTVVAACAMVLAFAGCAEEPETAPSTIPSLESPTTVSSSAPAVQDGPLTPTGTTLAFGEAARVMYETESQGKDRTKIAVTPVSVKQGSISDFQDVDLSPDEMSKDFFYVTANFTNLGPLPMGKTAVTVKVEPHDTAGTEMDLLSILGSFPPCDHQLTDSLAVGATFTACAVYVAPKGSDVANLVFTFNDYLSTPGGLTEITWPPR